MSNFASRLDYPVTFRVKKIVNESPEVKTFFLEAPIIAKPGQFAMVWLPGVDEKPFTVAFSGKELGITVQKKGIFTEQLFNLRKNDFLGVRGPYGNGFTIEGVKKVCIVAGGVGMASLNMLANEFVRRKVDVKLILGARTKKLLLYVNELKKLLGRDLYIITDDGSAGEKGFATFALGKMLKKEKFDLVYACGPEEMLVKVFDICEKHRTKCELSLERYMKCGFGICGQCAIDEMLVCVDGPVFGSEKLRRLSEFGSHCRLKTGKKVSLDEFKRHKSAKKVGK